jgi:hypothetical protein
MATCGSKAMGRSPAELLGLVSVAVHTVPYSLLFPHPFVTDGSYTFTSLNAAYCGVFP